MADFVSTVGDVLKTTYATQGWHDQVNQLMPLVDFFEKNYDYDGTEFVDLLRFGGNYTYQGATEDGALPGSGTIAGAGIGSQKYDQSKVTPKLHTYNARIGIDLIQKSKTNKGAFMRGIQGVLKGAAKDVASGMELELCGDGSGTIGVVASAVTSGTTIQLDTDSVNGGAISDGKRFIVGATYNVYSARTSGATLRTYDGTLSDLVLTAVNLQTGVLTFAQTFTGSSTVAANDMIVQKQNRTSTLRFLSNGLDSIASHTNPPMDTGGLQTITVAAQPLWAAARFHNSGVLRPLGARLLTTAYHAVEINANTADIVITTYGAQLEYDLSQQNVKRTVNSIKLKGDTGGGYKSNALKNDFVEYAGRRIMPGRYIRANTAYVGDASTIQNYYWSKWQNLDMGEGPLKHVPGSLQYELIKFAGFEWGVETRNAWARIEDLDGVDAA